MKRMNITQLIEKIDKVIENKIYLEHPYCWVSVSSEPGDIIGMGSDAKLKVKTDVLVEFPMFGDLFSISRSFETRIRWSSREESMMETAGTIADLLGKELLANCKDIASECIREEWIEGENTIKS